MLLNLRHFRPLQSRVLPCKGNLYGGKYTFASGSPKPQYFTPNKGQNAKTLLNYKYVALGTAIVGGTAYYYLSDEGYKNTTLFSGLPAKIRTVPAQAVELSYTLDSANGPIKKTFTHLLLDEKETEEKLKAGESKVQVNRNGNPVKSWELNSLPSGITGEDRHSIDIVTKADLKELLDGEGFFWQRWWNTRSNIYPDKQGDEVVRGDGKQDLMMFSVFDGHGGPHVADLLSRTLHGCLAWNAGKLFNNQECQIQQDWEEATITNRENQGIELSDQTLSVINSGGHIQSFAQMIAQSFLAVDNNIITSVYATLFSPVTDCLPEDLELPPHSPAQLAISNLFDMGSCAVTAIVDATADKLYVANVGDTRAVAGWWDPQKGEWRCDILSADATCENEEEAERVRNEHPDSERETAVHNQGYGDTPRIHGGLQPARAFGDHAYKLKYDDFKDIIRAMDQREPRKRWKWFEECPNHTPPYVTARPEVAARDIHPESGEELKFVILATDGLWDRVTSEEASYLLAAHLIHQNHPDVPKTQIMASCPHAAPLPEGEHPYPKEELNLEGKWVFEDVNAATHLIRNNLGGDDRELRRQFMSLKVPGVRSARDDITAMVIWFDDIKGKHNNIAECQGENIST